jgi:hypothetical protein
MNVYTLTDYERCKVLGVFKTAEEAGIVKSLQKVPIHCHIEEVEIKKDLQ